MLCVNFKKRMVLLVGMKPFRNEVDHTWSCVQTAAAELWAKESVVWSLSAGHGKLLTFSNCLLKQNQHIFIQNQAAVLFDPVF